MKDFSTRLGTFPQKQRTYLKSLFLVKKGQSRKDLVLDKNFTELNIIINYQIQNKN